MSEQKEVWLDIEDIREPDGTCAYQVSNFGNVRRSKVVESVVDVKGLGVAGFTGRYTRRLKPKMLKTTNLMREKHKGFTSVSIKDVTYPVHRLVAKAFLRETYKPGLTVNHKDGNRFNNNVDNLEWCTYSENEFHSHHVLGKQPWNKGTKGLMPKEWSQARKSFYSKRNKELVMDKNNGMTIGQLSEKYKICKRQVHTILQLGVVE